MPQLKSNKLYLYGDECSISIPRSTNNQLSSLEYLDIAHWYTFDELSALLSYTPRLRCLKLSHSNWYDFNPEDIPFSERKGYRLLKWVGKSLKTLFVPSNQETVRIIVTNIDHLWSEVSWILGYRARGVRI